MENIIFQNRTLSIDGNEFELDHQIRDARLINDLAVVIYAFDQTVNRHRQFRNCKAFDSDGKLMWTAEHPTNATADYYVEFMEGKDNQIWNFGCFVCELDFSNGRLKKADFTK